MVPAQMEQRRKSVSTAPQADYVSLIQNMIGPGFFNDALIIEQSLIHSGIIKEGFFGPALANMGDSLGKMLESMPSGETATGIMSAKQQGSGGVLGGGGKGLGGMLGGKGNWLSALLSKVLS